MNDFLGTYPIKPCLPAVGGNEGVFEVIEIGSNCNRFKPGDRALPAQAGWGKFIADCERAMFSTLLVCCSFTLSKFDYIYSTSFCTGLIIIRLLDTVW